MITGYITNIAHPPAQAAIDAAIATLPLPMQQKILAYKDPKDRLARLTSKLQLKKLLEEHAPEAYHLSFGEDGRGPFGEAGRGLSLEGLSYTQYAQPCIPGGPHFSSAHSGDYAITVINTQGPIGVDIEQINRKTDLTLLQDSFNPLEWTEIMNAPDPHTAIFALWVKKEAVAKVCGKGVFLPMNEIDIKNAKCRIADQAYYIRDIFADEMYKASVATGEKNNQVRIKEMTLEHLFAL